MNTHSLPHGDTPDKPQNGRHIPPFVRLQWAILRTIDATPPNELDTPGAAVLMALAWHINDRGEAIVGRRTLANRTKKSTRQLQRIIARLCDAGWLEVVPGMGRDTSAYTFTAKAIGSKKGATVDIAMSTPNGTENEARVDILSTTVDIAMSTQSDRAPEESVPEPLYPKNNPKGVKGESPDGGGVGNAATNHDAAPATNGASLPEELRAAWLATFGELTDKQTGFMRNAIKEHGAEALTAAISAAREYRRATGKPIAKPAGFVRGKLQAAAGTPGAVAPDYGFLAKNAPRPAQAGDTGADWGAIAADTTAHRQPAPEAAETAPAGASAPAHRTAPQNAAQPAERAPAGKPGKPVQVHSAADMWRALVTQETTGQVGQYVEWLLACQPAPEPVADGVLQVVMPSKDYAGWMQAKGAAGLGRKVRVATGGAIAGVRFIDAPTGHD